MFPDDCAQAIIGKWWVTESVDTVPRTNPFTPGGRRPVQGAQHLGHSCGPGPLIGGTWAKLRSSGPAPIIQVARQTALPQSRRDARGGA